MEFTTLANGVRTPMLGLGVYQVSEAECEVIVEKAFAAGYRLIDTAQAYRNERGVGAAFRKSGLKREDVFLTTKIWVSNFGDEKTYDSYRASLEASGLDYWDLVLLHQSWSDYYGAWRALERLYDEGLIRAIGVSNFYPERLADLCVNARIRPMVNQIECHPFFQRGRDLECAEHFGVRLEAWGPFAEGGRGIFTNPVITKIAEHYGKTPAQVALRFSLEEDVIVLPKSTHTERMQENLALFDFALTKEDLAALRGLDTGRGAHDPDAPGVAEFLLNAFRIED